MSELGLFPWLLCSDWPGMSNYSRDSVYREKLHVLVSLLTGKFYCKPHFIHCKTNSKQRKRRAELKQPREVRRSQQCWESRGDPLEEVSKGNLKVRRTALALKGERLPLNVYESPSRMFVCLRLFGSLWDWLCFRCQLPDR